MGPPKKSKKEKFGGDKFGKYNILATSSYNKIFSQI